MVYFLPFPHAISRRIFFQTGCSRIKFVIGWEYKKIQPNCKCIIGFTVIFYILKEKLFFRKRILINIQMRKTSAGMYRFRETGSFISDADSKLKKLQGTKANNHTAVFRRRF